MTRGIIDLLERESASEGDLKATFSDFEPPNALFVWNPVETG